jgi:hypothetical protein
MSNDNPFPIHDPSISCNIKAPSGTVVGRATATAYEIVPAGGKKAISDLRMEFYDPETLRRAQFPAQVFGSDDMARLWGYRWAGHPGEPQ